MSTAPTTLIPGYKQVDSFGPDEEYEGEEEVCYVTLDLGAAVEPTLVPSSSTYRLIGLDTPTPFIQLSGTIFKGQHDVLLGTELIFTEAKGAIEHVANTEQRVRFKEVQLSAKSKDGPDDLSQIKSGAKGKGKKKASVDMITGKSAPQARRKGRQKGTKNKGKEKEIDLLPEPEDERIDDYNEVMQLDDQDGGGEFSGLHRMDEEGDGEFAGLHRMDGEDTMDLDDL
ncbi:hypothetical protein FIBSPDRAFT_735970 [Athelia psychrophila]|uniref:Transcription factor TFIIIC triple barrel domain-containing protein n=1 Tax=Athelia psychrophila TaxID=1759441 RepID=A0A166MQZ6_9AGAM|nr:hypothetical protein FIBSPDRAFT_735970 [Fibularhizoctonia sp. CBS 109695]